MKSIRNINAVLVASVLTILVLPIQAHADWVNTQMHPMLATNLSPNQGQTLQHEIHVNTPVLKRVEPQRPAQKPRPVEGRTSPRINHTQSVHHVSAADYPRHQHIRVPFPDDNPDFTIPDELEVGMIVDSIPPDYQVVMVDGVNYLVTGGIYYQRTMEGFEVVEAPTSDQE